MLMEPTTAQREQAEAADPQARQAALALCANGDVGGARRALVELLAQAPHDSELLSDIAAVSYLQNDFDAAFQFARDALLIDITHGPSALTLGMALAAAGRNADAADILGHLVDPERGAEFQRKWPELAAMAQGLLNRMQDALR